MDRNLLRTSEILKKIHIPTADPSERIRPAREGKHQHSKARPVVVVVVVVVVVIVVVFVVVLLLLVVLVVVVVDVVLLLCFCCY